MSKKLEGKVAVITGGSTGIGFATAKRFVEEGAHVIITGRRQKELDEAVKELGPEAKAFRGDVSNMKDLDALFTTVKEKKGHLDILFANAGGGEWVHIDQLTEDHYDKTFATNVKGVLFSIQKALPLFKNGGSIIMTGSVAGSMGLANFSVYNATKAALRSFARSLTTDLKGRKIRVNVISPGPIKTPILAGAPQAMIDQIVSQVPLGRMGEPDEIAKAAVYLASDDSSFVTGAELFVDGGMAQV